MCVQGGGDFDSAAESDDGAAAATGRPETRKKAGKKSAVTALTAQQRADLELLAMDDAALLTAQPPTQKADGDADGATQGRTLSLRRQPDCSPPWLHQPRSSGHWISYTPQHEPAADDLRSLCACARSYGIPLCRYHSVSCNACLPCMAGIGMRRGFTSLSLGHPRSSRMLDHIGGFQLHATGAPAKP